MADVQHQTDLPPQRRSLREEHKQLTRRRLADAAVTVFLRDGYVAGTVEDIAAVAGTSRATFYLHFRGKGDLVEELLAPLVADSRAVYTELNAMRHPSREDLRDWMARTVTYWERNGPMIEVVHQAVASDPKLSPAFLQAVDRSVDAMMDFLVAETGMAPAQARLTGTMLVLQLERFCFFWIVRGLDVAVDREEVIDTLTAIWLRTLRPAEAHAGS